MKYFAISPTKNECRTAPAARAARVVVRADAEEQAAVLCARFFCGVRVVSAEDAAKAAALHEPARS